MPEHEYNTKSSHSKARKKKFGTSGGEPKLGKISVKSRSKESTTRRTKIDSLQLKKSKTENKEKSKQKRGNSLRSTGVNWKAKTTSKNKNRNKSLR